MPSFAAGPDVQVVTAHAGVSVIIASVLLVAGLGAMVACVARFRRTFAYRWVAAFLCVAILVIAAASVLVAYLSRVLD